MQQITNLMIIGTVFFFNITKFSDGKLANQEMHLIYETKKLKKERERDVP
jgi:hypothetical protein